MGACVIPPRQRPCEAMRGETPIGLVFDLDGTLVDSAPAITAVANEFLATLNLAPLTIQETVSFIGGGSPQFVGLMLKSREAFDAARFDQNFASFSAIYRAASPELNQPFPGAEAALRGLAERGHAIALCTNKPAAPTQRIVEALGWDDLFGAVIAGDTLPVKKPNPAPLREAARRIGCLSVLFFGDSETDAATAKAAGEPFVLFTEGYRKSSVEELAPAAHFSHYEQLRGLIESL